MKSQEILNSTFNALERAEKKTDEVASGILDAIRMARATTLDKFDELVYTAYDERGWNYRPGRPQPGVEIVKVPSLIRTYVSTIRCAYHLGLQVTKYDTIYALRQDVRMHRAPVAAVVTDIEPAVPGLEGIRIARNDRLTGAPIHDLAVVYTHVPEEEREALHRSIDRLVRRYQDAMPVAA